MGKVVEVNRLTKSYGNVKAINEISFTLESNKIYGLLGRNGAGKTTIIIAPVSLQQLIIHMTNGKFGRKGGMSNESNN